MEQEKKECLERGLKKLTDLQSTVIYLTFVESKTQEQIAEKLSVAHQSIVKILGRALAKLRKEFPEENQIRLGAKRRFAKVLSGGTCKTFQQSQ